MTAIAAATTASPLRWPCATLLAALLHAALLGWAADASDAGTQDSAGVARGAGEDTARIAAIELRLGARAAAAPAAEAATGAAPAAETGGGGRGGYYARLRAHLQRYRRPLLGDGAHGTAVVAFRVDGDGAVSALVLQRSAGTAVLDAEALDLLRRAAPLPRPPEGRALQLTVPIVFE